MKGIAKEIALAVCGGCLYVILELLWRGRSHWTMFILGAVSISNAEGNNRFYGTYHEVKILPDTLQDEQLRALTE